MNEIWLQIDTYDEFNNCEIIEFSVSQNWLQKYLGKQNIKNFLQEYTSDESTEIYALAQLQNAIINEQHQ